MSNNHWCKEHEVEFFKRGKMKGYAHPIEGTEAGEWCNEPEGGGDPMPEDTPKETGQHKSDGKNRSFALSYAKDIGVAKVRAGKSTSAFEIIETAVLFESYLDNGAEVTPLKGNPSQRPIEETPPDRPTLLTARL